MKPGNLLVTFFFFIISNQICAQLTGVVTDQNGEALPYVNIYVENTSIGTTTNLDGEYSLKLNTGQHDIVFQFVGYKTKKISVDITQGSVQKNIQLYPENYQLEQVVISANAEDPAYAIIRKAQAKRKYYKELVKSYECDAYMRGFNKILDAPEKILGVEIGDLEGVLDSTRQGVVYLSESVSKLYYKEGQQKEVMYSSKISGDDQGYSFNSAKEMTFDFYSNTLDLNTKLISPIANSALSYYNYKLEGAQYDNNGQLVNKIKVIPKSEYSPCFHGHIYINEDLWNIQGIDLGVTSKATKLAFIDSLTFKQSFVPLGSETWMPFSNVIQFKMKALGFVLAGNFAAVYSNYKLEQVEEDVFGNEVFVVEKEANERTNEYWETLRPIPLTTEEKLDYIRKDSIRIVKESPEYLDSIDRENNKFGITKLFSVYNIQNSSKRTLFQIASPLNSLSANTIQGFNGNFGLTYSKSYNKINSRNIKAEFLLNYGLSEKVWRPQFNLRYRHDQINDLTFNFAIGKALSQFNADNPISYNLNFLLTMFARRNYLKAYDKEYIHFEVSRDIAIPINLSLSVDYENRSGLENNYDGSIFYKNERVFTDNIPVSDHQAFILEIGLRIKPGEKVWTYPNQRFKVGSNWPTFNINLKNGLNIFGSDVSYSVLSASALQRFDLGSLGSGTFYVKGGGFVSNTADYLPDYIHFLGNQTHIGNPFEYKDHYLMLPYYNYSTVDDFYEFHVQHDFSGFILGKIPLLKRLGWSLIGGYKHLKAANRPNYFEYHIGIDNIGFKIFRLFRLDFVWTRDLDHPEEIKKTKFGIVIGVKASI